MAEKTLRVQHLASEVLRPFQAAASHDDAVLLQRSLAHLPAAVTYKPADIVYGAYIPGNLPFLSVLAYGMLPALAVRRSVLKIPPTHPTGIRELVGEWASQCGTEIEVSQLTGASFARSYPNLDAVLFCGRKATAEDIWRHHSQARLFMFVGSAINPFIIDQTADVDAAVQAAVFDRTYNGGADCLSSDQFLVHRAVWNAFLNSLASHVAGLTPCSAQECAETVGRRSVSAYLQSIEVSAWRARYCERSVFLLKTEHAAPPPEFMWPVWNVALFDDVDEAARLVTTEAFLERAHGVTYYGDTLPPRVVERHNVVAHNVPLHSLDHALVPFGGWNGVSSYTIRSGRRWHKPVSPYVELMDIAAGGVW